MLISDLEVFHQQVEVIIQVEIVKGKFSYLSF